MDDLSLNTETRKTATMYFQKKINNFPLTLARTYNGKIEDKN